MNFYLFCMRATTPNKEARTATDFNNLCTISLFVHLNSQKLFFNTFQLATNLPTQKKSISEQLHLENSILEVEKCEYPLGPKLVLSEYCQKIDIENEKLFKGKLCVRISLKALRAQRILCLS